MLGKQERWRQLAFFYIQHSIYNTKFPFFFFFFLNLNLSVMKKKIMGGGSVMMEEKVF